MSGPSQAPLNRSRSILVVEDDPATFTDIELALASLGSVTHASDGLDALRLLRLGLRPDVIVTDVIMPKMDGIALCRFVKNHPATARIPVVMFSSAAGAKDMVAGISAGARQYLLKSDGSAALATKVRESIRP